MTRSPSTTRRAVSVMLEPTSPGSLSTVTTSSSATFSCLPPQRTIAYTRELSLSFALPSVPRNSGVTTAGSLERAHGARAAGYSPIAKATRRQCLYEPRSFGRVIFGCGIFGCVIFGGVIVGCWRGGTRFVTPVLFVGFIVVDSGYAVD